MGPLLQLIGLVIFLIGLASGIGMLEGLTGIKLEPYWLIVIFMLGGLGIAWLGREISGDENVEEEEEEDELGD